MSGRSSPDAYCVVPGCSRFCWWQHEYPGTFELLARAGWVQTPYGVICPSHARSTQALAWLANKAGGYSRDE